MSEKLSKLEQIEKKAQDALRKAKAELKKERDEQSRIAMEKRNKRLISLAGSFLKLSKDNPSLLSSVVELAQRDLTPSELTTLKQCLTDEGLLLNRA